jgi:hypothetical protein
VDFSLQYTNITFNAADETSAVQVTGGNYPELVSCQFESNVGTACVTISNAENRVSLLCLRFRRNICEDGKSFYRGLLCIYTSGPSVVERSIFENNSFIWLVGAFLTFESCYFDELVDWVRKDPRVEFDNCAIGPDHFPSISDGCIRIDGLAVGVIIGVTVGVACLIVIVVVVVVCCVKRQRKSRSRLPESLREPLIDSGQENLTTEPPVTR